MNAYTCPVCKRKSYSSTDFDNIKDKRCPYCFPSPIKKQNPVIKDARRLVRRLMGHTHPIVYIKFSLFWIGLTVMMYGVGGACDGIMTIMQGTVMGFIGLGLVAGAVG